MGLHAERRGHGPRIVLVHGFTQTRRSWGAVEADLASDHETVVVDAPGHGRSAEIRADLDEGGRLLVDEGREATYLGYSMGARFCLHAALAHPQEVRGLVLLGATAGIDDPTERAARRQQDLDTAERLADQGLESFLDGWLAQPLFAGIPPERAGLTERLENTVPGLRSSLELAGTGSQAPSWARLASLTMPVLALAGADDAKFAALAERIREAVGSNATVALVPGAGHAAHLEQPGAFLAALRPWLTAHRL